MFVSRILRHAPSLISSTFLAVRPPAATRRHTCGRGGQHEVGWSPPVPRRRHTMTESVPM
jgi:hypothetical protein